MPDFGAPVAQNVQPASLQNLSTLMGLKQQQLAYQKAQATYDADVSQRQAESSLAQTNASVGAQTANARVAQQQAQTGLSQFQLTGAHAAQAMQLASGLISDPDFVKGNSDGMVEKLNDAQNTMTKQYGIDPKIADATITTLKYQALHNPGQVRQSLINMTQQQQGGAGQQAAALPAPAMVNTGSAIQPTATGNPALTGVQPGTPQGAPVALGIAPGQADTVTSDSQGNQFIVSRDAHGTVVGTRPVPGTQGTGGQGGSGPVNLPANMTGEQRNALAGEVSQQATQAGQAGGIHAINQQIYDLAGKPDTTNKYGEVGSKLRQAIGVNPLPGSNADDYDSMTKMLAQSNMRMSQSMGVHTDQQSSQVAQASGSQHYTPEALKNVVSVNDAMVKAQQMYAQGLSNAINTKGYGAANDFKTQWGGAFDLGASEYMAAKDSGSATRLAEIKTKLGLNDPKAAAAMGAKIKAMHDLAGMQ